MENVKTTWKDVPAGVIKGAEQRLWSELDTDARRVAEKINNDPVFLKKVGGLIRHEIYPAYDPPIFSVDKFGQVRIMFKLHRSPDGEEWINHITSLGGKISDSAMSVLVSDQYRDKCMLGKYYDLPAYFEIVLFCGMSGKTEGQIWQSFKSNYNRLLPNTRAELACILVSAIPPLQWKKWGMETVVILHEGFTTPHQPTFQRFLAIDVRPNMLITFDGYKEDILTRRDDTAFAILDPHR